MSGLLLRLHERDERVLFYLLGRRHPGLDQCVRWLTHLGGARFTIVTTVLLILLPAASWRAAGWLTAIVLAASHLAVQLLKRSISRTRPALPVGIQSLVEAPDRFSFPSGHAAASLSLALGLSVALSPGLALFALGGAVIVGLSRCYLGVHYPGDVLAGWLLAFGAFAAAGILTFPG